MNARDDDLTGSVWAPTPRPNGHWPSCTGPCNQGRGLCPSPQACQLPVEDAPRRSLGPLLIALSAAIVIGIGVALVRYFIGVNA